MALIIKHNRANHTHENEQFRRVASLLKFLFNERNWSGLLIGNPYNESYPLFRADALLFYEHGLIIIDFKNYSGTIKLPKIKREFELSQWYIESDDDKNRTIVKAGNRFINPFKQLVSYREALKEIIHSKSELKNLIQEKQICILNIFSGPLKIENSVPKELPFYKIIQESDLGTFLYDYSSENKYSEKAADIVSKIFNAEDWLEHIQISQIKSFTERIVQIHSEVETIISDFLKMNSSGILVLESMSNVDRDNWVQYILSNALDFNIPQIETWIHSARIGRKVSLRLGFELQSLFTTIYSGDLKSLENESNKHENEQYHEDLNKIEYHKDEDKFYEEELQEIIPIRTDNSIDHSAVIILHEAHLVSRSLHQSELLRFGSGRLLEDLLKFLRLDKTKRKLICIGDPYSLTYGKDTESAINLQTLAKLFDGKITHYRKPLQNEEVEGKIGLRTKLAHGIQNELFNELTYPWKANDLLEIDKNDIPKYLTDRFSIPFDSEPTNIVMVYSNKDAKKINLLIKNHCIKNGNHLAKNDLLVVNNNVYIPDETGFGQPTKLYNGMFLLVEEIYETINEYIPIRKSPSPILLSFTKIKVKCLSLQNKLSVKIWLLDNYFQNEDKLSTEEQIAFHILVNKKVSERMKEQSFEESEEYILLTRDKEYKNLLEEEKNLKVMYEAGEEVKTKLEQKQRELKKIKKQYIKKYKNQILLNIIQTDPFVNAVHAKYGWSLTVHKCIGSNFTNAMINAYQGENRGITNAEYYRWLYSGITTTSDTLYIANPQIIHPLMEVHFEDTTNYTLNKKKTLLTFKNYKMDNKFSIKISDSLNDNVKGSICELSKSLESMGLLLESVKKCNEYLTKVNFSTPSNTHQNLIIAINNKGEKDNWGVSSIRIEKSNGVNENKINEYIEALFYSAQDDNENSISLPTDFREKIYKKWISKLSEQGFNLKLIESHKNQDIFKAISEESMVKFRVWYRDDGFISRLTVIEKTHENLGENLKKWLIDEN